MNTTVTFICDCGNLLNTSFNTEMYNYHAIGCENCGTMYDVSRPSIPVRHNFSRADKQWMDDNGFDLPKELEGGSGTDHQQYLQKHGKLVSRKEPERK